ncbi:ubiquitin carboxyl-terminal hydrolase 15 [Carica papaya]|uniref:ubiquitin carboxyl-terminal hydrolase 15 n=1 Tax=Carica papaya TaxID=3649 RepID=UPI000B8CEAE5|nr:ubiquitin carboxyl-terminal hydrolase 15 [Carica papaya]XP_021895045.1 ubiquitin carboxyl-terminal hydrolase 15 [Carica papaya]
MLEPREADIPVLFLVLVVLPLVAYVLLGIWSEAAKKRERVSLLAHLAAEEALRAEAMAAASVIPLVTPSKNGLHVCARCFSPATTRCSRCKAVKYCSGKCQIIHWRQAHKRECQPLESGSSCSSPKAASIDDSVMPDESMNPQLCGYNINPAMMEQVPVENINHLSMSSAAFVSMDSYVGDASQPSMPERRSMDKRCSHKSGRESLKKENSAVLGSFEEISCSDAINTVFSHSLNAGSIRQKSSTSDTVVSEEILKKQTHMHIGDQARARSTLQNEKSSKHQGQHGSFPEPRSNNGFSSSSYSPTTGANFYKTETEFLNGENLSRTASAFSNETVKPNCCLEKTAAKGVVKTKSLTNPQGIKNAKLPKSPGKVSGEHLYVEKERKREIADESKGTRTMDTILAHENSGVASVGIMKMMGLRKSTKLAMQNGSAKYDDSPKKIKMLFPYEEFVRFFQCEVFNLSPRGLVNCGNSCYANAALQCLTSTKPLIIYLLQRSHSRACCGKDWCLMCELERHVMMLRETGGPLSPSKILLHMRSINCHIGDGSQEDAHEFLRLLVASMQSICLEGLGGESKVDSRLQETTFIQHTFGGRLQSKVKCLRCSHESERYENIMDLTLEIYGWVESLEDALTQFTTPEDLDGENMYRCGRCAAYVRARKQLSIHEAPNILTIVLKRFQEGRYGKINKCITFPDMLDMIPFMTRSGDIPPLYMLYAVVVHLDTLNASFSGHYVSYVKDLQGNWFRIDDTEVRPVPMSQVMSEGAYILFYMRSCPRPQRVQMVKTIRKQVITPAKHSISKDHKPSRTDERKPDYHFVGTQPSPDPRPEIGTNFANHTMNGICRSVNNNSLPTMETSAQLPSMEFSDATLSDWSLFTSSDEASFTTESTRDSFSTVDYADADPFSIFSTPYGLESSSHNTVACRMFANSRLQTRFFSEEKGYVVDSYSSWHTLNRVQKRDRVKQVSDSLSESSSDCNSSMYVKYGSNLKYPYERMMTSSTHCIQ